MSLILGYTGRRYAVLTADDRLMQTDADGRPFPTATTHKAAATQTGIIAACGLCRVSDRVREALDEETTLSGKGIRERLQRIRREELNKRYDRVNGVHQFRLDKDPTDWQVQMWLGTATTWISYGERQGRGRKAPYRIRIGIWSSGQWEGLRTLPIGTAFAHPKPDIDPVVWQQLKQRWERAVRKSGERGKPERSALRLVEAAREIITEVNTRTIHVGGGSSAAAHLADPERLLSIDWIQKGKAARWEHDKPALHRRQSWNAARVHDVYGISPVDFHTTRPSTLGIPEN